MKSYNLNLLWITLLMLSLHHTRKADSFQCYECENCPTIGENDKNYLKECGLPEIQRPNRPVTTPNWEEEEEEEDVEEDLSDMNELEDTSSTTKSTSTSTVTSTSIAISTSTATSTSTVASSSSLSPTASSTSSSNPSSMLVTTSNSTANTTPNTTPYTTVIIELTTADAASEEASANNTDSAAESETSEGENQADTWPLFPRSKEENDLISSKSEENVQPKKVRKPRQLPGNKPVCYVLKVKYDGFEITNRGCGAAVADRNLTCKMLSKGQPYVECGICEGNMCNSAPSLINGVMGTLYILVMIAVYSW